MGNKSSIARKLTLAFGMGLLVVLAVGALANMSITHIVESSERVGRVREMLGTLEDVVSRLRDAEDSQRGYLLTGEDSYLGQYRASTSALPATLESLHRLHSEDVGQQHRLDALGSLISEKRQHLDQAIEVRRTRGPAAAADLVRGDRYKKVWEDITNLVADVKSEEAAVLRARQDEAQVNLRMARAALFGGTSVAAIVILMAAFLLLRGTRPLIALLGAMQKVAAGDLRDRPMPVAAQNVSGMLIEAFNKMLGNLREQVGNSQSTSVNLNTSIAQISASTRQQAASTSAQLAAVQETSATMAEVAQSGVQIADKSRQVGAAAEAASAAAVTGIQAVRDASRTMETIREQVEVVAEHIVALSEKTKAVGEIIATVNDIADRSNLLALNAAIEAAAVGAEGSRFSVVAAELKNLADQSKDSTVQVRSILGDIQKGIHSSVMLTEEAVKRVESGRHQADATEQVVRRLVDVTQQSVQAFQQISAATNQQQIGFEQVTQSVRDIRNSVELSAQGIAQLDSATSNLATLSQQLRLAVERFQV